MQFSANLGFLWNDQPLPDAIHKAKAAGFAGVELHWPYATPATDVADALRDTGLPCLGLNTQRGDVAAGDNGCTAIPGREAEARDYIDEALAYADAIGAGAVHVMAGFTDKGEAAQATFTDNLTYACAEAAKRGKTILIEPLNAYDAPGYHHGTLNEALAAREKVAADNLKIMFDCYHLQIMGGDLLRNIKVNLDAIGHIQFAAVPDRGEPDQGEVDYQWLLHEIEALGWQTPFGAEYKARSTTDAGIGWLDAYR
ncbi:hydroxypyruvate isomerase [Litoreibacter ponti]|uniref:Hydroxypyruvate isomerase n=2 Tax=Litoreibacter ponti TaxID=1510457 RepID=A0A2T6BJA4_9RHOB|nr:TIM barrel protein [Litoreibacter ponti]PTX56122.1 hydroxypyruvate isomerase [Litoreibacter ponti]